MKTRILCLNLKTKFKTKNKILQLDLILVIAEVATLPKKKIELDTFQKQQRKKVGRPNKTHLLGNYSGVGVGFATLGSEAGESIRI